MNLNDATQATTNAVTAGGRSFSAFWTRQAARLLRAVATNPEVTQARNSFGGLDENGHGKACANQVLIEFLNGLRHQGQDTALGTIDRILPVTHSTIISWNDSEGLTFEQIAERLEAEAGDQLYAD